MDTRTNDQLLMKKKKLLIAIISSVFAIVVTCYTLYLKYKSETLTMGNVTVAAETVIAEAENIQESNEQLNQILDNK
jgi:hypothetical protein